MSIISTVVVILVVLLAAVLVGGRIFGFQVFTVLSGSMGKAYPTGSIIYVQERKDVASYNEGDVITFRLNKNKTATHRIIEVIEDRGMISYRTKGDANPEPDTNPVPHDQVIGKVRFGIPLLGYFTAWVQSPPGLYYAIGAGALLILLMIAADLLDSKSSKQKKTPQQESSEDPSEDFSFFEDDNEA